MTLAKNHIRLNVGRILVLQLEADRISVYCRKKLGSSIFKALNIPSSIAQVAPKDLSSMPVSFWDFHTSFIDLAARTQRRSAWLSSYSQDIIIYLERLLRTELPRPSYVDSKLHLVLGGVANQDKQQIDKATSRSRLDWVVPKSSKLGDEVVIYIAAHGFYARAIVRSEPRPAPGRKNRYLAQLGSLKQITPISLETIKRELPMLAWSKYPRSIYSVPAILASKIRALIDQNEKSFSGVQAKIAGDDFQRVEGARKLRTHFQIERNGQLARQKKASVYRETGKLACEVCSFDFGGAYGKLGEGFCEVHHRRPLSKRSRAAGTSLHDLAIVCANCHRIIHRGGENRRLSDVRAALGR